MDSIIEQATQLLTHPLWVRLALGVAILIVGWVVALAVSAVIRRVLARLRLNERVAPAVAADAEAPRHGIDLERLVTQVVFYVLMLFVIVAFFEQLQIRAITEPLNAFLTTLMQDALPRILGAGAILLLAWIVASFVRLVVEQAARLTNVDDRLSRQAQLGEEQPLSVASSLATAAYWLVFLLFLPAVFGRLQMTELAQPIEQMTARLLDFLPNGLGAALILLVGWFLARIVRQVVANLLAVAGADDVGRRVGLFGDQPLAALVGTVVYAIIMILVAIQALTALRIEAISGPAIQMLSSVFGAIPSLVAAGLLLLVAYYAGRLVSGLATTVLEGVGFDRLPARLGIAAVQVPGDRSPSHMAGLLVLLAIMLFAGAEAASLLGFGSLAGAIDEIIAFGGQLLVALVIFGLGLYLANIAFDAVRSTGSAHASSLAWLARGAITVLVAAMALEHVEVGQAIVQDAFRAVVFALAAAAALAFGLGGREAAALRLQRWLSPADRDGEGRAQGG